MAVSNKGAVQQAAKQTAGATPAVKQAKPVNEGFGALKKYERKHTALMESKAQGSPDFMYRDTLLEVGPNSPKRSNSVMGKIRDFVALNGPISGADLVKRIQKEVVFENSHPSDYVRGGKPTLPWIEDYIKGMVRKNNGFLAISTKQPKKA